MITFSQIRTHLQLLTPFSKLPIYPIVEDAQVPVPVRHLRLAPSGGYGEQLEGVLVNQEWQFRTVGRQADYDDAETLAWLVDQVVLGWSGTRVSGVRVVSVQRSGSPPTYLLTDDSQRAHFVCSYLLDVE